MKQLGLFTFISVLLLTSAGISPVHDIKSKLFNVKDAGERVMLNSPHRVLQHLDNSITKATKNVTQNPKMEDNLYQISKDLVTAILSKLEVQDKITRITREALEAPGQTRAVTAIETRRILDYLSRTLSGHILSITRSSTEPELHRLVYGLAQIAAEVSIVSALKDITYSTALSKKQSVDLYLRKKRSIVVEASSTEKSPTTETPPVYNVILNKTATGVVVKNTTNILNKIPLPSSPYSVFPRNEVRPLKLFKSKATDASSSKAFLNQTILDMDNAGSTKLKDTQTIVMGKVNATVYAPAESHSLDTQERNAPALMDDWLDPKENIYKPALSPEVVAEMEFDQTEFDEENAEKKSKQKFERLEAKAKKAILYAGDVAYLAAASVVAMRRALTASIEVQMSVKFAKNGLSTHQDLMMNLARTAAQQAGKEAKSAASKSIACERVIKLALKYTSQSHGATLNHIANRIVMDTLSLGTLAKSMAFVSSDIAINSLYQATDVKPPS